MQLIPPNTTGTNHVDSNGPSSRNSVRRHVKLRPPPSLYKTKLWTLGGCLILLLWTIFYVVAFSFRPKTFHDLIPTSGSSGCTILLRVATEAAGQAMGFVLGQTLESLFWTRVASEQGTSMPSLLSISPSTDLSGLWALCGWSTAGKESDAPNSPPSRKRRPIVRIGHWIQKSLFKIVGILVFPIRDLDIRFFKSRRVHHPILRAYSRIRHHCGIDQSTRTVIITLGSSSGIMSLEYAFNFSDYS
jgi:hypothetical protein